MRLRQHVQQAMANLLASKLRSFLAVLGIMVGTGSVVALVISGELATQKALSQFKALGTDLLSVALYEKEPSPNITPSNTLTMEEWQHLQDEAPAIVQVAPYASLYDMVSYRGQKINGAIIGADETLQHVIKIKVENGDFVSFVDHYEQFCVIGQAVKAQMEKIHYGHVVGEQLWVGKNIYTVIGTLAPWTENAFFNEDVNKSIFVPVRGISLINSSAKVNNAIFRIEKEADIDGLIGQVQAFISQHAPALTVFPRSAKQLIRSMQAQGKIFTLLLGLIGGVSLLVGGIGVMNVMLVSVVERKKEIGIRKAIGARPWDIQQLFLIEAVVLALFGGTLGVVLGLGVAYVISYFTGWEFMIFWQPPLVGFMVSVATGIFFGFYPARRAAKLDPIETLRSE